MLKHDSRNMALDPRFYNGIPGGDGPPAPSMVSSQDQPASPQYTAASAAATTLMQSTASSAALRSTASSPSLRAREGVSVPATRAGTLVNMQNGAGGGNVRVVVRVRGFLPRGQLAKSATKVLIMSIG